MVVHDLKQPITAIKGYLQLLEMKTAPLPEEETKSYINGINKQTDSLLMIISSVLDINRLENKKLPLKPEKINIIDLVKIIMNNYRSKFENRDVEFVSHVSDAIAYCDKNLIQRVITNLLVNALKWTSYNGKIKLFVKENQNTIKTEIKDNGPGIPPAYQEKIFEKYWSKGSSSGDSIQSAGLGLAFCKLAVEANGGRIGVQSKLHKGSTFWFTLPKEPS